MELLRQIEGQQRDLDEIRELTQEIHDVLLIESATVREENFTAIHSELSLRGAGGHRGTGTSFFVGGAPYAPPAAKPRAPRTPAQPRSQSER